MNIVRNKNAEVLDSSNIIYDISICIITYNKAAYIKDAIESVLMQKTNCSYEIVVGDNNSTDGTCDILRAYWNQYPDKFTILLNDQNLGLTTNIYNAMIKAKGKYIVILYGDDYWIDENKLQIQFDFLEHNRDFIGVTSAIEQRYDGEIKAVKTFPAKKMRNSACTLEKYMKGDDFPLVGTMFRNDIFSKENKHFKKMLKASLSIDDLSFCILLLMKGNVFVLPDVMGVYRCFHSGRDANNFNSVNSKKKKTQMAIELCNNLEYLTNNKLNFFTRYGLILASAWYAVLKRELSFSDYKECIQMLCPKYKKKHIGMLLNGLYKKIIVSRK